MSYLNSDLETRDNWCLSSTGSSNSVAMDNVKKKKYREKVEMGIKAILEITMQIKYSPSDFY